MHMDLLSLQAFACEVLVRDTLRGTAANGSPVPLAWPKREKKFCTLSPRRNSARKYISSSRRPPARKAEQT